MTIDDPQRYGVFFNCDGDLAVKVDCNRVLGAFDEDGDPLTLTAKISTKALCPADMLGTDFLKRLERNTAFRREGKTLVQLLGEGRGLMEFADDTQD